MKGVRCVEGHIKKNPSFPTLKCVLGYTRKPRLTVGLEPTTESHNGCVLLVKLHISILEELSRIELLHRECPKVAKFHQFVGSARWRNFERDSNERLGDLPSRSMMWERSGVEPNAPYYKVTCHSHTVLDSFQLRVALVSHQLSFG